VIDVHSHVVPPRLLPGFEKDARWPRLAPADDDGSRQVVVDGRPFRKLAPVGWDLDVRAAQVKSLGLAVQVLSPMPELFCYWAAAEPAREYCADVNGWLAGAVRESSGTFEGLGIVPMQSPDDAAAALTQVGELGLRGVLIGSNINGRLAGAHDYDDFYLEAERLELAIFVHAFHPDREDQFDSPRVAHASTFPLEIAAAGFSLLQNGVLARAPRLRLALSHGGGALALAVARLDHVWRTDPAVRDTLEAAPLAGMRRMYYDCLLFSHAALRYLVDLVGHDRVVVGSDHPFFSETPGWTLDDGPGLTEDERRAIATDNALAYLNMTGTPGLSEEYS
jgi:aminocarboxymuconate-semialdehyde decarboxylase